MTGKAFDYVIVGAGAAGCVLANRLSEDADTRVLLLEAGGRDSSLFMAMPLGWRQIWRGPMHNWNFVSEPEPHLGGRRLSAPRGKTLGGSTSINGMLYLRGHPKDYDQWRQMGCSGWSYADVLPYFKRSEANWRGESEHHGRDGPVGVSKIKTEGLHFDAFMAAAKAAGLPVTDDVNGEEPEGFTPVDIMAKGGVRTSAARGYLRPALMRPNLVVETGALVRRVLIEDGHATGVEYAKDDNVLSVMADREVILAGGAYNSPHLLMLSGIGPADEIAAHGITPIHDLKGVGKNLQEHPTTFVQFATKAPVTFLSELRLDKLALGTLQWLMFKTGVMANQPLTAVGFVRSRPELERPDLEIFLNPVRLDADIWFPILKPAQVHAFEGCACLMHPESRGEVTLASADPHVAPAIRFNCLATPGDLATLREGVRMIRRLYASGPVGEMISGETKPGADVESDADLDDYLRRSVQLGHHPVGTCAMGVSDESVTDPELRVRGLEGLRVVDASIMPLVPGGHTTAPTLMLAEKAADMIRGLEPAAA